MQFVLNGEKMKNDLCVSVVRRSTHRQRPTRPGWTDWQVLLDPRRISETLKGSLEQLHSVQFRQTSWLQAELVQI